MLALKQTLMAVCVITSYWLVSSSFF